MNIREVNQNEAAEFLALCKKLDKETDFLLLEPGERKATVEEQKEKIEQFLTTENKNIFVVTDKDKLIGYLSANGGKFKRNWNTIYIVIGILQDYTGQGIGTKLFKRMENWARKNNFHRLELTVMAHNERAVNLYQKMGFEIEGRKREGLYVNGEYVDEYYMGKIIDD
jgi:RimJ/RimL family protein N-acetyltransferase